MVYKVAGEKDEDYIIDAGIFVKTAIIEADAIEGSTITSIDAAADKLIETLNAGEAEVRTHFGFGSRYRIASKKSGKNTEHFWADKQKDGEFKRLDEYTKSL